MTERTFSGVYIRTPCCNRAVILCVCGPVRWPNEWQGVECPGCDATYTFERDRAPYRWDVENVPLPAAYVEKYAAALDGRAVLLWAHPDSADEWKIPR